MKIKVLFPMLVAVYALVFCARFAQSTVAQDLPAAAKKGVSANTACSGLADAQAAFKAERYDQAINAAKRVLSTAKDSSNRTKAYRLLIASVRGLQGYNAAIDRAEGVYAYVLKTRSSSSQEQTCLKTILSGLKKRRANYEQTITEQRKLIAAHPKSEIAAQAALKIAICSQKLSTSADALAAYERVVRDYPLSRSGWKAAQEAALLRQGKANSTTSPIVTNMALSDNITVEDILKSLREGRLFEAEQTARQLLKSTDSKMRAEAAGLLIRAIAENAGSKAAAEQAWQLACGSSEFKPSYSDVLRLEACVIDLNELNDQHVPAKETVAEKSKVDKTDTVVAMKMADAVSQSNNQAPAYKYASNVQTAMPQIENRLPGMSIAGWSGSGSGGSGDSSSRKSSRLGSNSEKPDTAQPKIDHSDDSSLDGSIHEKPSAPAVRTTGPDQRYFDQWMCSKEYEDAGDDLDEIRSLVEENIENAQDLLDDTDSRIERRGLGVVLGAAMCAHDKLGDTELALSICDDYVLPHIKAASSKKCKYLSRSLIQSRVVRIWVSAEQYDKAIDMLQSMLDDESEAREADAYRVRLAQVCDLAEDYKLALAYLQAIDDSGDLAGAKSYIPELEKKIKENGDEL
ncbi:MAG: hypothetical protein ABFD49_01125 [Armatimonadota bacterium]|nr:hypothetical protein [bacterium]